ncbi:maleylpyruvate isomerase family mycothiol-dependent enzyme [Actinomadura chibensis]|uniref:Maleylpyruvate isomerase family mycothiol-dependent enzyme n=1 Tax=Actinomadura chibensis TaxID=392828 RepID=A0A5D0NIV2_9ACTN|nr:maleylpyruvate isomerase family mycothiol-dependent enzyme [Actinomadura chibensis]TYB44131.1 maleylpyruvate isomerase family mycothiol-dependent enzyme [Actinomadura chibensis]
MAARTLADARRWTSVGTRLLLNAATGLDETAFAAPSPLPGWTRKHVAAHVAANAEGLGNLLHWAATGEPTPMYASLEERNAGIERGAALGRTELVGWLRNSAVELDAAMSALTPEQWAREVVTAQGRAVPATEVPWLRAREVCVHAVDLDAGVGFADLPAGFLTALCEDVAGRRRTRPGPWVVLTATDSGDRWELPGDGAPAHVSARLPDVAAYLTGRAAALPGAPALPDWL